MFQKYSLTQLLIEKFVYEYVAEIDFDATLKLISVNIFPPIFNEHFPNFEE